MTDPPLLTTSVLERATDTRYSPEGACEALVLDLVAEPRSLESLVRTVEGRLALTAPATALQTVVDLVGRGVITVRRTSPADRPRTRRQDLGMFGCSRVSLVDGRPRGEPAEVAFFGVPYDSGATGRTGSRRGPEYLRKSSRTAFDYREEDGTPAGWWDSGSRSRVLRGVRFRDLGDVRLDHRRNGSMFDALFALEVDLLEAGTFPVALGGDHSISLPLITAAAKVYPGLGVLHLDAHSDLGAVASMGPWRKNCTHGNFMSWVVANPDVSRVVQAGVRHVLPQEPYRSEKVVTYPGTSLAGSVGDVVGSLDAEIPYYLTIDVDCLDVDVVSQTGTPIPGGFTYRELVEIVRVLTRRLRVVGADVVELIDGPGPRDIREGVTVSYVLFEVLSGVFGRTARDGETSGR